MLAAVRGDTAVLAPLGMRDRFGAPAFARAVAKARLHLTDAPFVTIDQRTGELVIEPSPLNVDWSVLDELPALGEHPRHEPIPEGRYRVRGWVLFRGPSGPDEFTRAQGLVSALGTLVDPRALPAQATLDGLARSLHEAAVVGVPWDLDVIVGRLADLLQT